VSLKTAGWQQGLKVTVDGTGVVSHAGVALVCGLADNTGLTAGLSRAQAWPAWWTRSPRGGVISGAGASRGPGSSSRPSCI